MSTLTTATPCTVPACTEENPCALCDSAYLDRLTDEELAGQAEIAQATVEENARKLRSIVAKLAARQKVAA